MAPKKVYVVERVFDMKLERGKIEYLVKWEDYDESENSWETEANLKRGASKVVAAYLNTDAGKAKAAELELEKKRTPKSARRGSAKRRRRSSSSASKHRSVSSVVVVDEENGEKPRLARAILDELDSNHEENETSEPPENGETKESTLEKKEEAREKPNEDKSTASEASRDGDERSSNARAFLDAILANQKKQASQSSKDDEKENTVPVEKDSSGEKSRDGKDKAAELKKVKPKSAIRITAQHASSKRRRRSSDSDSASSFLEKIEKRGAKRRLALEPKEVSESPKKGKTALQKNSEDGSTTSVGGAIKGILTEADGTKKIVADGPTEELRALTMREAFEEFGYGLVEFFVASIA